MVPTLQRVTWWDWRFKLATYSVMLISTQGFLFLGCWQPSWIRQLILEKYATACLCNLNSQASRIYVTFLSGIHIMEGILSPINTFIILCKMSHFKCHFVSIKPNDNTLGKCKNDKHEFNGQKQMGLTSFGVYHDMLLLQ